MTARLDRRHLLQLAALGAIAPALADEAEAPKKKKTAGKGATGAGAERSAKRRSTAPDPERVAQIAKMLADKPRAPGPTIDDRKAWDAVARAAGFGDVVPQAERFAKSPPPDLPDDLYLDYSRTGNRVRFQNPMFDRRRRLATLVTAECLENRGRFLPAIETALTAMLGEKSWVLPAHDGSLNNFRGHSVEIDLAAAACAATLATLDGWLAQRLASDTRAAIRRELQRRVLEPFTGAVTRDRPRLGWLTTTNNWNAVCLAGVTIAANATIDDRSRRAFFVAAAEKLCRHFLDGFTSDGYCSEGLGYWNYGFGHFVLLAENVFQATGGRLDLWQDPKLESIARFGRRLEIAHGVYPAFADCDPHAHPDRRIQAYVSRRFGFGWTDAEETGLLLTPGFTTNLFEHGLLGCDNSASRRPAAAAQLSRPLRDWFQDAGILIGRPAEVDAKRAPAKTDKGNVPPDAVSFDGRRRASLGVALKGGHNAEHHNHNDVGSFTVALGGTTPLLDPGSEVYTSRTFSTRRYDSKVLNSFGHPVPRVAGRLQRTGRSAQAKLVRLHTSDVEDTLVFDLASAYDVPGLAKLERTFTYSRSGRGRLVVCDVVALAQPEAFETALITFDAWSQPSPNELRIGRDLAAVLVAIDTGGLEFRIHADRIEEQLPGKRTPTRLAIQLVAPVREATIRTTIWPA